MTETGTEVASRAAGAQVWEELRSLLEAGRTLEAHAKVVALGGYRPGPDPGAAVTKARLAVQLGAPRKCDALLVLSRRADRRSAEAAYFHHYAVLRRRGPYAAYRYLRAYVTEAEASGAAALDAPVRASIYAGIARTLAALRDFERAAEWMARALALGPDDPWIHVVRAYVLEHEDRLADAEAAVDRALVLGPTMRSVNAAKAHFRSLAGDPAGAIAGLEAAGAAADNFWSLLDRGDLLVECERHVEALAVLDRAVATAPLAEPEVRAMLDRRIARAALLAGDRARALEHASRGREPWDRRFAERLARPEPVPARILLPVPYVRQSHVTCAPATLASITAYYGSPVDHDALAERICYAGTPSQRERSWAEAEGYVAHEFDVTVESARALLERGHPFTLVTRADLSSHLQAVVGHDPLRDVFLVRDPGTPLLQEIDVAWLLESHRHVGPRGMTLVPKARAAELEGLALPNASAWDVDFALRKALDAHDGAAAAAALEELRREHPDHHLRELAEMIWAYRAGDAPRELELVDAVLARKSDAVGMLGRKGALLADVASRAERLRWLESLGKGAPLSILKQRAEALLGDATRWPEAEAILERLIRRAPTLGSSYYALAELHTMRGRPSEALELYRLASCLEPTQEHLARAFFDCASRLDRGAEARAFLVARVERARGKSSEPARTLFQVHADEGRLAEGLEVLEALTRLRPDDGDLLLECAGASLSSGRLDDAKRFLERAEGRASAGAVACARARIAHAEGHTPRAIELYREAIALEPTDESAVLELASILYDEGGPELSVPHLEEAHARAPESRRILTALCEHLRGLDRPRAERILRRHLERHPDDAWSRRELALAVEEQGRPDEALALCDESLKWLPQDAVALAIRGGMLLRRGDAAGAMRDLRAALSIDIDLPLAITELVSAASDARETDAALEFVLEQLAAQRSRGPGVEAYGRADWHLSRDDAAQRAEALAEAYPRLPEALILRANRLADAGRLDEAWARIVEGCEAFPHVVSLWATRARIAYRRQDLDAEASALRRAVVLAPRNVSLRADLAASAADRGDVDGAIAILQEGIALAPRDPSLRGTLAALRHRTGDLEGAIDTMKEAVRLAPGHDGNFRQLVDWLASLGRRQEAIALVREILPAHRASARVHFMLADAMWAVAHVDEQVAALEQALRLAPRYFEAVDLLAVVLTHAGRYEEALASCPPPSWKGPVPVAMEGRRAWILAQRGSLDEAIAAMEAAVSAEPGYAFGLDLLVRWYAKKKDPEGRIRAAERWAREIPTSAEAHAQLGFALVDGGERERGVAELERALELAPGHFGALHEAIELHLADGGHAKASRLLEAARPLLARDALLELDARLAIATGRADDALAAFAELLVLTADPARLARSVEALAKASKKRELVAALERALVAPTCRLELELAHHLREQRGAPLPVLSLLRRVDTLGPAGIAALGAALEDLGRRKAALRVRALALFFGSRLARHDTVWGSLGFAYVSIRAFAACIAWMRDFRDRAHARPWMLLNLVQSLWALRRGAEATEVAAYALELVPDHASAAHRQWLALGLALDEKPDRAARLLDVDRGLDLPRDEKLVRRAAETALAVRRAGEPGADPAPILAALRALRPDYRQLDPVMDVDLRRAYHEVLRLALPALPLWRRIAIRLGFWGAGF